MSSQISHSFFQYVPREQQELLFKFHDDHPYSKIMFQNQKHTYLCCGKGDKTVVFLHGALVKPDMWFYPILKLEKWFRIIAPYFNQDMTGLQQATDFLKCILSKENISKIVLVGYSLGGGIAQYFAEQHPELVDKLVLSHTGILGREEAVHQARRFVRVVKWLPFFLIKKKLMDRIEDVPTSTWNEFHRAYFTEVNANLTKPEMLAYGESMLKLTDEAENFSVIQRRWQGETVILGTRGDEDTFKYFDQLQALYPHAQHHIFNEDGGHHMIFLFPEIYTDVLIRYLD